MLPKETATVLTSVVTMTTAALQKATLAKTSQFTQETALITTIATITTTVVTSAIVLRIANGTALAAMPLPWTGEVQLPL